MSTPLQAQVRFNRMNRFILAFDQRLKTPEVFGPWFRQGENAIRGSARDCYASKPN
jgi:hypothetical protein